MSENWKIGLPPEKLPDEGFDSLEGKYEEEERAKESVDKDLLEENTQPSRDALGKGMSPCKRARRW
jgi:hypothetical protein